MTTKRCVITNAEGPVAVPEGHSNCAILCFLLLATSLVALSWLAQGNIGINLMDEGHNWYGAERTILGEVPVRDFRSYDPGRYYWSAAWSLVLGPGILAHRVSNSLFQVIGLCFGLLVAAKVWSSKWMVSLVGVVLLAWMMPRYKLFESAIAMIAVWIAVFLIERPSLTRHFSAGVFVGLAAFIGRNHGIYNFLGFTSLILFLCWKTGEGSFSQKMASFGCGILTGYLPMLCMMAFVPGFFYSYSHMVWHNLKYGMNLPLPVPWPWTIIESVRDLMTMGWWKAASFDLFVSLCFVVIPIFYLFTFAVAFLCNRNFFRQATVMVACTFVGVFYQHHAFLRADASHLAESFHPFLLGILAVPYAFGIERKRLTKVLVSSLVLIAAFMGIWSSEYIGYFRVLNTPQAYVRFKIGDSSLYIRPDYAQLISCISRIVSEQVPKDQGLLIGPFFPGLYPILNRKSPVWEIFFTLPTSLEKQEEMIVQMKQADTAGVIMADIALDGRNQLRFRETNPLLWAYIKDNFAEVASTGPPISFQIMIRTASH